MMSRMFRLACVLICVLGAGSACSRTSSAKAEKAQANETSESTVENITGAEKAGISQAGKQDAVAKKPVRQQTMTRGEYAKRVQARQKYLRERRAWIQAHRDQFHALP